MLNWDRTAVMKGRQYFVTTSECFMHVFALLHVHCPCFSFRCWIGRVPLWRIGVSVWKFQNCLVISYMCAVHVSLSNAELGVHRCDEAASVIETFKIYLVISYICAVHISLSDTGLGSHWCEGATSVLEKLKLYIVISHICAVHVSFLRYLELGAHHCGIAASVICAR
jgi:hypothetical protein